MTGSAVSRAVLALLLPAVLTAQQPPAVTAIRAGTLIDGTGAAPIRDAVILVQGDRITAVGAGVAIPRGAAIIDLSAFTVLPGFIDAHVHLTGRVLGDGDWQHDEITDSPAERALRGALHARQTLAAGFTTVRDVGGSGLAAIALRNAVAAGWVAGPRIRAAGTSFGINGGHCDASAGFWPGAFPQGRIEDGAADGPDEIREAVRYNVKYGADLIKICATGGVLSPADSVGAQQYTEDEMRAAVEAARLLERPVAAHAHGTAGIKAAVRAGVTSIEHGSVLDEEAVSLMRERGTWLVPTLMAGEAVVALAEAGRLPPAIAAKAQAVGPLMGRSLRLAIGGGVRIALGTDAGVFPHGRNGHEFTLLVRSGMTPMQAIVAGTQNGAILLGMAQDVGTVATGKLADLVAVRGDPLTDIALLEAVAFVMQGGRVVRAVESAGGR